MFVSILCEHEPDGVIDFLQSHTLYRLDQCLKITEKYGVDDASAYLYERAGDFTGSLLAHVSEIRKLLEKLFVSEKKIVRICTHLIIGNCQG